MWASYMLLYIGINPVVSHGHATATPLPPPTAIRAVRDRGEVWLMDPRRNETASFSSHHIAPMPGTDYAILGYLIREVLAEQPDPDILKRVQQLDELREAVARFDLATASELADVPDSALTALRDSPPPKTSCQCAAGIPRRYARNTAEPEDGKNPKNRKWRRRCRKKPARRTARHCQGQRRAQTGSGLRAARL